MKNETKTVSELIEEFRDAERCRDGLIKGPADDLTAANAELEKRRAEVVAALPPGVRWGREFW